MRRTNTRTLSPTYNVTVEWTATWTLLRIPSDIPMMQEYKQSVPKQTTGVHRIDDKLSASAVGCFDSANSMHGADSAVRRPAEEWCRISDTMIDESQKEVDYTSEWGNPW
jgi:hypothetical protein